MMLNREIFFIKVKIYLLSFFMIMGSYSLIISSCIASETQPVDTVFSLDVKDVSFKNVLDFITTSTGYEISINKDFSLVPVTVELEDITLDNGLKRLLKIVTGSNNHVIITDTKKKKVKITLFSSDETPFGTLSSTNILDNDTSENMEIGPPPESGSTGLTLKKLKELRELQKNNDLNSLPEDMEIGPPSEIEGPGLTVKKLKEIQEQEVIDYTSLDENTVIGPPPISGGSELTVKRLKKIQKLQEAD